MPNSGAPTVLVVIPARYASTRFPGKPLAPIAGKPMIQHVVEHVRLASLPARIIVATEDQRIKAAVEAFGGEGILTRSDHRTGTDRIAEVAAHIPADIYINVQGDEPLINPGVVEALAAAMAEEDTIQLVTPCTYITQPAEIMVPNVVKVVQDFDGNALYFSRAPIPWVRDRGGPVHAQHLKHLGLYAFRRAALLEFATFPQGDLERIEQLEQLRWMENGYRIRVAETGHDSVSVDMPE